MHAVKMTGIAIMLISSMAWVAQAEFSQPSEAQIAAAATNPGTQLAGLLQGASPEQAAEVAKAVLLGIVAQDLPADVQQARVASTIQAVFAAFPNETHMELAAALGAELGADPVLALSARLLSSVQAQIATIGARNNLNLGQAFAGSFLIALEGAGGGNQPFILTGDEVPPPQEPPATTPPATQPTTTPPSQPPPVAPPYQGQAS